MSLHEKYVQSKRGNELIVVHNMHATVRADEARQIFERQITQCYDGEHLQHLGGLIFTVDHGDKAPNVHHIGICQDGSAAGERFNPKNLEVVRGMLEHGNLLGSWVNFPIRLREELQHLLPGFVRVEQESAPSESVSPEHAKPEIMYLPKDGEEPNSDGYGTVGAFAISTAEGHRAVIKKRGVLTQLGEIVAHNLSFDPLVNIYDTDNGRIIKAEIPGVPSKNITFEAMPNGVKIAMEKHIAIEEHQVEPLLPIRQNHGIWMQEFVYDHSDGRFEFDPANVLLEHGVLTVKLVRTQGGRKWNLSTVQEDGFWEAPRQQSLLLSSSVATPSSMDSA